MINPVLSARYQNAKPAKNIMPGGREDAILETKLPLFKRFYLSLLRFFTPPPHFSRFLSRSLCWSLRSFSFGVFGAGVGVFFPDADPTRGEVTIKAPVGHQSRCLGQTCPENRKTLSMIYDDVEYIISNIGLRRRRYLLQRRNRNLYQ